MKVLKIIFRVILGIIQIPFTLWYILIGWFFKLALLLNKLNSTTFAIPEKGEISFAIFCMEFASLTKFYHLHW